LRVIFEMEYGQAAPVIVVDIWLCCLIYCPYAYIASSRFMMMFSYYVYSVAGSILVALKY